MNVLLRTGLARVSAAGVARRAQNRGDGATLAAAAEIVGAVRSGGEPAVRGYAERFGEVAPGAPLVLGPGAMRAALERLDAEGRRVLERTALRIRTFAEAQRAMYSPVAVEVPGGRAGHTVECVGAAGCYAPGGRYPLPSSVLMTAVTARVAGCDRVVVASPNSGDVMLAAAAIAGVDEFLCAGGAHAVAAMAYGAGALDRVDVVVGPGNTWVTCAKQLVSGVVGIDMLAGPSELLIVADADADAEVVAADLLAQAEHDAEASAMLVSTSAALADRVDEALARRLAVMETRETAARALGNGWSCVVGSMEEAVEVADCIAAEHVEVMTRDAERVAGMIRNAGGIFVGAASAEVLGDYGAGPNHTLPTGGTARFQAGLSVGHFLRLRTWLRIDSLEGAAGVLGDAVCLAEMEGLAGHADAARLRARDDRSEWIAG